jgi:hypothetical protein
VQGNICIVEDATKCLERGVRLFNTKSWMNEEAKFRDNCCQESAPYPRIETVCGDRPEEAPSVLSLSASFFCPQFYFVRSRLDFRTVTSFLPRPQKSRGPRAGAHRTFHPGEHEEIFSGIVGHIWVWEVVRRR